MSRRIFFLLVLCAAAVGALWSVFRSTAPTELRKSATGDSNIPTVTTPDDWLQAVEQVKADRGEPMGGGVRVETPRELRHYSERYWFLAAQVAEVAKHNIYTCQDYLDLAAMIQGGELVAVPAVADSYVLFGVGERADESPFTRYQDTRKVELYDEAQLNETYKRLEENKSNLKAEIESLKLELRRLTRRERTKRRELENQIAARRQELNSIDEEKLGLDEFYSETESREKLFQDYESLQDLAKNFGGNSYNLVNPADRQALKVHLLSSLRPAALKILEEVASAYHEEFARPLPVSSLVRPEQYQRALRKVNRNAIMIDTPPHSTGLAFDIDFRYMSAAEQSFVMDELARIKNEGRIEVIRESNANYHVFAFLNGTRPSDDLIAASLDDARPAVVVSHHARKPAVGKSKSKNKVKKARQPQRRRRK